MIEITLYSGCKLNDNYKNVFAQAVRPPSYQTSFFDTYLSNLNKITFTLDLVYQDDMTSFTFYLKDTGYSDIYTYNYMRIETLSPSDNQTRIVRYAFINSIQIKNDVGIINYKIDVWHSFANNLLGINKSYLKGLRVINGTGGLIVPNYYTLPVDYSGNEKINIPNPTYNKTDNCILVMQIQTYDTREFGNASYSRVQYVYFDRICRFQKRTNEDVGDITSTNNLTFDIANEILERIIDCKTKRHFAIYNMINNTITLDEQINEYFDIGNVYIIPAISSIKTKLSVGRGVYYDVSTLGGGIAYCGLTIHLEELNPDYYNDFFEIFNSGVSNNFKLKSIGLLTYQIPIETNGTSIPWSIYCSLNRLMFKLFLSVANKFVDITEHFKMEVPFTQMNGEVLAQQKISRELANRTNLLELINSATGFSSNVVNSFGQFGRGNVNYARGMVANDADIGADRISQGAFSSYSILQRALGITGMLSGGVGMLNAGINLTSSLINFSNKRNNINAPVYNSSSIILSNNISILNAIYWIKAITIDSDNDDFVKESINQMGYNVFEYISNINELGINNNGEDFNNNGILYNTIQLGHSDVYGNFPLNIKKQLDAILENGIKIWYNNDIDDTNDRYVVG